MSWVLTYSSHMHGHLGSHREWVRLLAAHLKAIGFDVLIDVDVHYGDSLTGFMRTRPIELPLVTGRHCLKGLVTGDGGDRPGFAVA
jgi:hypothetical protein